MFRILLILLLTFSSLACKKTKSEQNSPSGNDSLNINAQNISTLDGLYTIEFSEAEGNCTLDNKEVSEDIFDTAEDLPPESFYCKSSKNLELFCGESEEDLIWTGTINKNGLAKLRLIEEIKNEFKKDLIEDIDQSINPKDIILDCITIINFKKTTPYDGYMQYNFEFPYEEQTFSCKTKLPITLSKDL